MNDQKTEAKKDGQSTGLALATGSPIWCDRGTTPLRKGWYITRRDDGFISWRAWGNSAWWKQIKGGWMEWFDGDGNAARYDWQPGSRQSIDLGSDELPDLANDKLRNAGGGDPAQAL